MVRTDTELIPLRPEAALLLKRGAERVLLISDLHIGWEVALAKKGFHLPSQTQRFLKRLRELIRTRKPTRLIILGDVKHTIARIEMEEWRDVPDFFEKLSGIVPKIQVIPGNHDGNLEPLLPENIDILPSTGIIFGDVGLFHGHTWPHPEMLKCTSLIIGHVHPVVTFRDPTGFRITRQVWVKSECNAPELAGFILRRSGIKDVTDPAKALRDNFNADLNVSNLLIMPSFNDFLGGQAINRRSVGRGRKFREFIGPVLRSGSVDIGGAEVYLLDGTFLGTVSQLRAFS
ncbi:MAG: metallophosphoesterase [Candidatus Bathyarchaeia archaeon]